MKISDALIVVVDTETTGLSYADGDRIVEFAAAEFRGTAKFSTLVYPGRSIPPDVSGVHHLTDSDVLGAPAHDDVQEKIKTMKGDLIVAHNAAFDRSFLPSLADRRWLCSQRLAKHLLPDAPDHKNQTLRYYLLENPKLSLGGLAPHRAMADVIVTRAVFEVLVEKYLTAGYADDIDTLIAYANSPIRLTVMPFGKHRGPMKDIPTDYLVWSLRNMQDLDADLRYTLQTELAERRGA